MAATEGATVVDATPSTYHALHAMSQRRPVTARDLSSVRMFCSGGAPLPPTLAERSPAPSPPLLDGYGSNEAGNIALADLTIPTRAAGR
uniref:AMP-binding protein n=1 Tax=Sphingopyxis terrae TaxID=33052 RepID=UPI0036D3BC6B